MPTLASGHATIHHPGGGSDDYADALMLACWAFRRQSARSRVRVIRGARSSVALTGKNRQDADGLTAGDEVDIDHMGVDP